MSSSDGPFYALRSEYARVLRALEGLPMSLCSARCARTSVVAHLVLDLPWASSAVQAGFPARAVASLQRASSGRRCGGG